MDSHNAGLEVGEVIDGKYRIVRLIGEGGMGAVYEGEHLLIHRKVAIKVLLSQSADNVERFEREAQAAGRIGNDHILEVLDIGKLSSGDRYMVLEYLDGETLAARMEREIPLGELRIAPLMLQVLQGLAAAHAAGIIHRDLKPENIFILREKVGKTDFVKIIDFGISKFAGRDTLKTTQAGALMGTPNYMSPEQAQGAKEADVRSDIFAIGVILYEAVTGMLPHDGANFSDILFKIVLTDPPLPSERRPDVDPQFEKIILRAIARDRDARYQSVGDLAADLGAWLEIRTSGVSVRRIMYPDEVTETTGQRSSASLRIATPDARPMTWSSPETSPTEFAATKKKGSKTPLVALASVAVIAVGGWLALRGSSSQKIAPGESAASSTPALAPHVVADAGSATPSGSPTMPSHATSEPTNDAQPVVAPALSTKAHGPLTKPKSGAKGHPQGSSSNTTSGGSDPKVPDFGY